MRKLNQISIRKYIILGIMFIMLLIMVLMLMFVNRLAEGAIEEDVQVYLINAMVDGTRNISFVDGRFEKGELTWTKTEPIAGPLSPRRSPKSK